MVKEVTLNKDRFYTIYKVLFEYLVFEMILCNLYIRYYQPRHLFAKVCQLFTDPL